MNLTVTSAIPAEVRDRVIAAATDLYAQSNRERFPTVDAVRRASRADMNTVSVVMKQWRQSQTAQAAPVAVTVPEAVQQATAAAAATIWQQATELANQSLRSAQASWEAERQDLDDMRAELSNGYETTAAELDTVKNQLAVALADLDAERQRHEATAATAAEHSADLHSRLTTAEARTVEIEHRVNDFKVALTEAHAAVAIAKQEAAAELDAERQRHAASTETASTAYKALAARLVKVEGELSAAREQVARLEGGTDAIQKQNADLLRVLAEREQISEPSTKPPKPDGKK